MTEVAFHYNAPDLLVYACRLLRKAVGSGAKVVVTGPPDTLRELDALLWTFSATDFVPHCMADSEAQVVAASPVVLATSIASTAQHQVLLNLGRLVPEGFDRFERVIELVGQDEQQRQLARARWKQYTDRGYAITRHDLTLKTSD
ncbi:MAG: DNA polymerase III subunit chi [Rhodoferax sp.]|nr:DNA polymerase III subunit chi [Rhodoferax sp.]